MRWAPPGKARWDMSSSDELRKDLLLPLVEPDADTEVDLAPSHVHVFTPPSGADLSVTVMAALKMLTDGYEAPSRTVSRDRSGPHARR